MTKKPEPEPLIVTRRVLPTAGNRQRIIYEIDANPSFRLLQLNENKKPPKT
ncbi:hypothetical protein [Aquibium microcysteis]|uniref:hypothetical protein n=1 Tax=Aquibium microcysteis TaxID=675281 RepID=UPI00165D0A95|nr:hypothetical protein [Aquibium microcysteis]